MEIKRLIEQYRLPAFLMVAVIVAGVLVTISMHVYYASGAAQLDLSRPEYIAVRSQIAVDKKNKKVFDAQGEITDSVLEDFLGQYKQSAAKVLDANAFSVDVLSDEELGF